MRPPSPPFLIVRNVAYTRPEFYKNFARRKKLGSKKMNILSTPVQNKHGVRWAIFWTRPTTQLDVPPVCGQAWRATVHSCWAIFFFYGRQIRDMGTVTCLRVWVLPIQKNIYILRLSRKNKPQFHGALKISQICYNPQNPPNPLGVGNGSRGPGFLNLHKSIPWQVLAMLCITFKVPFRGRN